MALLLNPRNLLILAVACLLTLTHFSVYRAGRAAVRADFDAYKLSQAAATQKAQEEARAKEQAWQANFTKAQDDASKREKTLRAAAAGARTERDRLRDAIAAATGGLLPSDTPATILERAATIGGLLNQCTERYQWMAEQADRHASDAVKLRDSWPKSRPAQ